MTKHNTYKSSLTGDVASLLGQLVGTCGGLWSDCAIGCLWTGCADTSFIYILMLLLSSNFGILWLSKVSGYYFLRCCGVTMRWFFYLWIFVLLTMVSPNKVYSYLHKFYCIKC